MRSKIGRNHLCLCGSGKKYKKCCEMVNQDDVPIASCVENDGFHYAGPFDTPSSEELDSMTKEYQETVRNSPLWDEMVQQYGKKEAEILLKEFQVKFK